MLVNLGDPFGRRVQLVGGDAENAVARRAGSSSFAATSSFMGRDFHQYHPYWVIGPTCRPELDQRILQDIRLQSRRRERPLFDHFPTTVVANATDLAAADRVNLIE